MRGTAGMGSLGSVPMALPAIGQSKSTTLFEMEAAPGRVSFWLTDTVFTLGPLQTADVPVHFCPTRLGPHAASLLLLDPQLGEITATLTAVGELPPPISISSFRCAIPSPPCALQVDMPSINQFKEAALCEIPGALEQSLLTGSIGQGVDSVTFNVSVVGAPSFHSSDKITLAPGKPSATGRLFAPTV